MKKHPCLPPLLALAAPLAQAAEATASVRTYAQDSPHLPSSDEDTLSGHASSLPVLSYSVIVLPQGYSFRPDADGFLSRFGATVPTAAMPEPQTWALLTAGLGVLAWRRRRMPAGQR